MDSELTNYASNLHINNTSYQRLLIFPTQIVYSLLILVVYAKMHKFQSQYASQTRWQICT